MPLQRVIADFGSDHPFHRINPKLKEHYGIEVVTDSARKITLSHAKCIAETEELTCGSAAKATIIGETDGCMVPIVQYEETGAEEPVDKRKHKALVYCEARLSLAHEKGSVTPVFAGTMGSVQEAGDQLVRCVEQVGFNEQTKVHCVGDGAAWIANQVEKRFGANGSYLIDFYHLCEYLSAAAPTCAVGREESWLGEQKALLKENQAQKVLIGLKPSIELKAVKDVDAPVRSCYRYIENRLHQLDYKTAIENGLPIGSGEIESAHRYVIQNRLKIAGAWWKKEHAGHMLALRVCRANNGWNNYWIKRAA